MLHYRIRQTTRLTASLESAHQLVPGGIVDERWRVHLEQLADDADARRVELGQRTAHEQPGWAVEALGPVPEDPIARAQWEHRAGWAAAHRELVGHDDALDPLGAAPAAGLVEKHTMWRTAHEQLDLPDRGPDEAAMSDGQLRCRVAAWEREQTWAPRWVGDALAATSERLGKLRADVAVWRARAADDGALPAGEREQLAAAAAEAEREAGELEAAAERLREADDVRADWYAHTAVTRDHAIRARAELSERGVDVASEPTVTAAEWLAEHRAAIAADEATREVTDLDVHDEAPVDAQDVPANAEDVPDVPTTSEDVPVRGGGTAVEIEAETAVPDVRETATADPTERRDPKRTRVVPTDDEVAVAVERARAALRELYARGPVDEAAVHDVDGLDGLDDEGGPSLQRWADEPARSVDAGGDVPADVDERAEAYT
ncbi:hypothetical protein BJF78_36230 [Pseudonocardia sp. CNS-139]|nr:hypothetical protein BJF78_36230 [Pseudonocardia sp. CNS-139]